MTDLFFPTAASRTEVIAARKVVPWPHNASLSVADAKKVVEYCKSVEISVRDELVALAKRSTPVHFNDRMASPDELCPSPVVISTHLCTYGLIGIKFVADNGETTEAQSHLIKEWIEGELSDSLRRSGYNVSTDDDMTTISFPVSK